MHSVSVNCMLHTWRGTFFCPDSFHITVAAPTTSRSLFARCCMLPICTCGRSSVDTFKSRSIVIIANSSINICGNYLLFKTEQTRNYFSGRAKFPRLGGASRLCHHKLAVVGNLGFACNDENVVEALPKPRLKLFM